MDNPIPLVILDVLLIATAFAWPRTRQIIQRWTREIVETPLRLITGRRRPNYAHIARLERSELQ